MAAMWCVDLPLAGRCCLEEADGALARLTLVRLKGEPQGPLAETPLLRAAAGQLADYFTGLRRTFDLPLAPAGTNFQQQVWRLLLDIPYGQTASYGDLARALSIPKGAQAVGQAVGANPLPFLIPCHRVLGRDNTLTGYALGLPLKRALLELEGISYR